LALARLRYQAKSPSNAYNISWSASRNLIFSTEPVTFAIRFCNLLAIHLSSASELLILPGFSLEHSSKIDSSLFFIPPTDSKLKSASCNSSAEIIIANLIGSAP